MLRGGYGEATVGAAWWSGAGLEEKGAKGKAIGEPSRVRVGSAKGGSGRPPRRGKRANGLIRAAPRLAPSEKNPAISQGLVLDCDQGDYPAHHDGTDHSEFECSHIHDFKNG